MAIKLIRPDVISFRAVVTEKELRERMAHEVLEQIGGLDADGNRMPGIAVGITKNRNREGGYTIEVSGPMPARIMLPGPEAR